MKKDSCSVGPLRDKQGNLQSSAATQTTLLNDQFAYVLTSEDTTTLPELSPSPYPDKNHITIHTNGVVRMLRHIKAHKATGSDEMPVRLLKEAADQLAPMLTTIFQASYNQGTVCCKLMEHIMQSNIMHPLDSHSILNDAQHEFRKKRSCETQLLMVTADIHKALDNNLQMDGHPQNHLALKLEHYGVRGNNLRWVVIPV